MQRFTLLCSFIAPRRRLGAWWGMAALLVAAACMLGLMLTQTAAGPVHPGLTLSQVDTETGSKTQGCGLADLSCQDLTERDCDVPQTLLHIPERSFLAHASWHHPLARLNVAPPERPPRLQA